MKVDKILFVSDENLNYLTFWNSISRYYTKRFGFKCKLFFIGEKTDENKEWLSEEYGEVEVVKPLKDIPIIIQALWGKFWFTQTEPDTCWLIGDIDMYIFDKDYVDSALASIPDNGYGHISASDKEWYFYGYHHCASGKKFKEFLSLSDSFEDDCKFIFESKKYGIIRDGPNNIPDRIKDKKNYEYICSEEHLSNERLERYKGEIVQVRYPMNKKRFESPYAYMGMLTPKNFDFVQLFKSQPKESYIDFHCTRPYTDWSDQIETIIGEYLK
jgi:hypothetical protein